MLAADKYLAVGNYGGGAMRPDRGRMGSEKSKVCRIGPPGGKRFNWACGSTGNYSIHPYCHMSQKGMTQINAFIDV